MSNFRACIDNPPCGRKMALIPQGSGCGAAPRPHAPTAGGGVYGECPAGVSA